MYSHVTWLVFERAYVLLDNYKGLDLFKHKFKTVLWDSDMYIWRATSPNKAILEETNDCFDKVPMIRRNKSPWLHHCR
jgi:hypothetical protein